MQIGRRSQTGSPTTDRKPSTAPMNTTFMVIYDGRQVTSRSSPEAD